MRQLAVVLLLCLALVGCRQAPDTQAPTVGEQPPQSQQGAEPWESWTPPEVVMPDPNALDTYRQAFELLDASPTSMDNDAPLDQSRAYVKEHGETLKLLRKALAGECRVPAPKDYLDVGFGLKQWRDAAWLLSIDKARVGRADGHYLEAARDAIDTLRLGHDVATQRTIIATLGGGACGAIGLDSLERTIPHLTAAECRTAIEWLQQAEEERVSFGEVVEGEGTFARRTFIDTLVHEAADLREVEKELELPPGSVKDLAQSWAAMDQLVDGALAYADKPYWAADLAVEVDDPLAEFWFHVSTLALCRMRVARAQAVSRMALAHLASHAYWRDNGQPPDSLISLAPEYLGEVPTDPFSGKPLQAKRDGERFVIYSVGPDGTDDGGKEIEGGVSEESKGDLAVTVQQPVAR